MEKYIKPEMKIAPFKKEVVETTQTTQTTTSAYSIDALSRSMLNEENNVMKVDYVKVMDIMNFN